MVVALLDFYIFLDELLGISQKNIIVLIVGFPFFTLLLFDGVLVCFHIILFPLDYPKQLPLGNLDVFLCLSPLICIHLLRIWIVAFVYSLDDGALSLELIIHFE